MARQIGFSVLIVLIGLVQCGGISLSGPVDTEKGAVTESVMQINYELNIHDDEIIRRLMGKTDVKEEIIQAGSCTKFKSRNQIGPIEHQTPLVPFIPKSPPINHSP